MVKNPGTTPDSGAIIPLNRPVPVPVVENDCQQPVSVQLKGRLRPVSAVDDWWKIDEEWWRSEPVVRMYYRVRLADGNSLTIFRDLVRGGWYRQRA